MCTPTDKSAGIEQNMVKIMRKLNAMNLPSTIQYLETKPADKSVEPALTPEFSSVNRVPEYVPETKQLYQHYDEEGRVYWTQ